MVSTRLVIVTVHPWSGVVDAHGEGHRAARLRQAGRVGGLDDLDGRRHIGDRDRRAVGAGDGLAVLSMPVAVTVSVSVVPALPVTVAVKVHW